MRNHDDEEAQLLEVLELIDAHRNGAISAEELEAAIWKVRNEPRLPGTPWLWKVAAALLAAAIVLYAIA